MLTQEVNVPEVNEHGDVVRTINDLSARRYRWVMTEVDDSPTAKEYEYQQAITFLNSVPGPVVQADPSGKLLARFMLALPNRFLNEAGRALAQDAEMRVQQQTEMEQREELAKMQEVMARLKIDAERARKQGVNVTLTGADLAQFPYFFQWLQDFNMPTAQQQLQQPQQPQPQAAAAPAAPGVGGPNV